MLVQIHLWESNKDKHRIILGINPYTNCYWSHFKSGFHFDSMPPPSSPSAWHHHLSALLSPPTLPLLSLRHLKSIHSLLLLTSNLSPSLLPRLALAAAAAASSSLRYSSLLLLHSSPSILHLCFPPLLSCSLPSGLSLHSLLIKNSLASSDPFVQTALLRFYISHSLLIPAARQLFDEITHPDPVHFDIIMNAYLRQANSPREALRIFHAMPSPDAHMITTALTACSHAGALDQGVKIHKRILLDHKDHVIEDTYIGSALVNMYAKCGSIEDAVKVFETMPDRNMFMWSAMISGFAMHGLAQNAMECLGRMQVEDGLRPDGIIVLGVLAACAHAGLVREGLRVLAEMESRYCVSPKHEHYSCVVDMLCRVGKLTDAAELIGKMPFRPLASVWGSLLTGARNYKNVEMAETAVRELKELGGDDDGVYVQLSNVYRSANRLEDARRVRRLVGGKAGKKTAGYSEIEVAGKVSLFLAADQAHPMRTEVGRVLELMMEDIKQHSPVTVCGG